jgi:beta-galactosidase
MPVFKQARKIADIPQVQMEVPYLAAMPKEMKPGAEYYLTIQAVRTDQPAWAEASHVMAQEQFKVPANTGKAAPLKLKAVPEALSLVEDAEDLVVSGQAFKVTFDKSTGIISNYQANGQTLLTQGPVPQFWRAAMNNDRIDTNKWTDADATLPAPESIEAEASDGGKVQKVKVVYNLASISASTFVEMAYAVYFNGAIRVDYELRTDVSNQVYRIGADMRMPGRYENIEWLTRGPLENLYDRQTSSFVGRYKTTVSKNFWNYQDPQDTGTHEDTRWMAATDNSGTGLMVVATGDKLFEANALHYDWRSLDSQRHICQIHPQQDVILSVNCGSRGTGGASCGPETLFEYKRATENVSHSYTLVPISGWNLDIAQQYRSDFQYEIADYELLDVSLNGKELKATLLVGANSLNLSEASLVAAVYDSQGALVTVKKQDVEIASLGSYSCVFGLDAPLDEGQTLKVFAWTPTMAPLCAPASAK